MGRNGYKAYMEKYNWQSDSSYHKLHWGRSQWITSHVREMLHDLRKQIMILMRTIMNEKIYKTMSSTGACSLTVGIIVLATGIVTGIMMIVNGARLLKKKSEILI